MGFATQVRTTQLAKAGARVGQPPSRPNPSVRHILRAPAIQPKLKVGAVNDPAEAEADQMADRVMRMPEPVGGTSDLANPTLATSHGTPPVQRMCDDCEDELQRKPAADTVQRIEADLESDYPCFKSFLGGEVKFSALPQVMLDDIAVINEADDGGLTTEVENDVWYDCDGIWYRPESQWFKVPGHCAVTVTDLTPARLTGLRCCNLAFSIALSPPRWVSDGLDDTKDNPFLDSGEDQTLNRSARSSQDASPAPMSPSAESAVQSLGSGSPLPATERAFFEPRFGRDLSNVRLHTDGQADVASRAINARAFTLGNDVAFAGGEYRPGTSDGRRLMAHELTHTLQQSGGDGPNASSLAQPMTSDPDTAQRLVQESRVSCRNTGLTGSVPGGSMTGAEVVAILQAADAEAILQALRAKELLSFLSATRSTGIDADFDNKLTKRFGLSLANTGDLARIDHIQQIYAGVAELLKSGNLRYICRGNRSDCDAGTDAFTTPPSRQLRLCDPFWSKPLLAHRASTLLHEAFHIHSGRINDDGRPWRNAHCLDQFALDLAGVPVEPGFVGSCVV